MHIRTSRFVLRDLIETDRDSFTSYQMDPRYRKLYNYHEDDGRRANELFDLFIRWQKELPRRNYQIGVFESVSGRLCGCAGLRTSEQPEGSAVLGIELTPDDWGRYRLAIEVADSLFKLGFETLGLQTIVGSTSSGNQRVEKLARWFGASIVACREGPAWMTVRGWQEIDWAITRSDWANSQHHEANSSRSA